ncbi:MAG: hypothetical protein HQ483_01730 [Rhodospirillales bacterium]|nr:hypothetical protein [Rhodospirillales bacterium]
MKPLFRTLALTMVLGTPVIAAPAFAGTVENLERERAILVETLLANDMTAEERFSKVNVSKSRLIDLERIVLRDKSLVGRNTPAIKRAFANYDLTFMVHAAIEKDRALADHWLTQIGLDKQGLLSAQMRRR